MDQMQQLAALLGFGGDPEIAKALTTSSGFAGINLEPEAKLLLPLYAGLRSRIAVDNAAAGSTQATFRAMLGYGAFDFAGAMGTAEAGIGNQLDASAVPFACDYKTQATKGDVTLQAVYAAKGFDDALASQTAVSLSVLLKLEELGLFGGNETALVDGSTGTAVATGTGTLTAPVKVVVTALTLQGYLANLAADPTPVSNAKIGESVGQVITVSGSGTGYVDVKWDPVPGAFAYKVYAGATAAAAVLLDPNVCLAHPIKTGSSATAGDAWVVPTGQTFVTETRALITSTGTALTGTHPTADGTANPNAYEGMMAWATKPTMYGQSLGTRLTKNLAGQKLTSGTSGIPEFDAILQQLWNQWKISPSLILTSSAGTSAVSDALMGMNGGFTTRLDITQERGRFVGGTFVGGYVNKFAASMLPGTPPQVEVWAHPEFPDGTFLFLTERIPYAYARETRGWALDNRIPYTYWELAKSQLSYPFSLLFDQTLKCYHPAAQAALVGVRVQP
jgi:hypothetical protein